MTAPQVDIWPAVLSHLLFSTLFAGAVWLLALRLRSGPANIRHWLWLSASVKFVVPFGWLVSIGPHLLVWSRSLSPSHLPTYSRVYDAGVAVAERFSVVPAPLRGASSAASGMPCHPMLMLSLWVVGTLCTLAFRYLRRSSVSDIRTRSAQTLEGRELSIWKKVEPSQKIPLFLTDAHVEPTLFGVLDSTLIWPMALTGSLDDTQIEAIMRHELCHALRRDNLTMWIHMVVEAVFWFHPMVWAIEKRLVVERERACDEAVLDQGANADLYAESILQTCRFYLEAQAPYASCISGADLKERIRSIVAYHPREQPMGRKIGMVVLAVLVLLAPVGYGLIWKTPFYGQILLPNGPLPSFKVATIKLSKSDVPSVRTKTFQGSFTAEHASLTNLLRFAYRFKADDQLVGRPRWSDTEYFDVSGKVDEETAAKLAKLPIDQMMQQTRLRVQSLLAERFNLSVTTRNENRKVYALVVENTGMKLKEVESSASVESSAPRNGELPPPPSPAPGGAGDQHNPLDVSQKGKLIGRGASMAMFTQWLSTQQEVGDRTVVNQTGLGGKYDFSLTGLNVPVMGSVSPAADSETSVFTLIREQLGLKVEYKTAPLQVLVVERAERPSAN